MIWIGSTHPAEIAREFYAGTGEPWQTAGEQIAAEIEQRGKPLDWQPIETAPRDGTRIIGCSGDYVTQVFWDRETVEQGGQCWREDTPDWERIEPTVWQRFPDPPEREP